MHLYRLISAVSILFGAHLGAFEIDRKGMCHIDGKSYPVVGYGSPPLKGATCCRAILSVANLGYRIIDSATHYQNLDAIGQSLRKLKREEFYIISKVWPDSQTRELLHADLKRTLKELQTDYLDAYLIHWPASHVSIDETLLAMEELRVAGLIRHIGVSNFTINHLKRALEVGVPITWNQVEMNPTFFDPELLIFCKEHNIAVQAWGPLHQGANSQDPLLARIGKKYGKTPAQVALRWIIQHGCLPLPASKSTQHRQENLQVHDFRLTGGEMHEINERARRGKRIRFTTQMIGFEDQFDYSYAQCWPKN